MSGYALLNDSIFVGLLLFLALSTFGLMITLALYFLKKSGVMKRQRRFTPSTPRFYSTASSTDSGKIRDYGINEILSSGRFTAAERQVEYRRRGKSPSGVIDGVYNDMYRGNESYNDSYRDWDADA
jgi:hypothetical protein